MGKGIISQNVKQSSFISLQTKADATLQQNSKNNNPTNHPIAAPLT